MRNNKALLWRCKLEHQKLNSHLHENKENYIHPFLKILESSHN